MPFGRANDLHECGLGPKGGNDKQCEVIKTLPRGHTPRIEEVRDDLYAANAAAGNKLRRAQERYKGKKLLGSHYPKKYSVTKRYNAGALLTANM